jgi:hypothetical protein
VRSKEWATAALSGAAASAFSRLGLNGALTEVISAALQPDPARRPAPEELLASPPALQLVAEGRSRRRQLYRLLARAGALPMVAPALATAPAARKLQGEAGAVQHGEPNRERSVACGSAHAAAGAVAVGAALPCDAAGGGGGRGEWPQQADWRLRAEKEDLSKALEALRARHASLWATAKELAARAAAAAQEVELLRSVTGRLDGGGAPGAPAFAPGAPGPPGASGLAWLHMQFQRLADDHEGALRERDRALREAAELRRGAGEEQEERRLLRAQLEEVKVTNARLARERDDRAAGLEALAADRNALAAAVARLRGGARRGGGGAAAAGRPAGGPPGGSDDGNEGWEPLGPLPPLHPPAAPPQLRAQPPQAQPPSQPAPAQGEAQPGGGAPATATPSGSGHAAEPAAAEPAAAAARARLEAKRHALREGLQDVVWARALSSDGAATAGGGGLAGAATPASAEDLGYAWRAHARSYCVGARPGSLTAARGGVVGGGGGRGRARSFAKAGHKD